MNENAFISLFDSSDDELLTRAIDRFADGECSAVEEAELFARLDATPGAWKQCALALAEARDLRTALTGAGRSRKEVDSRTAFADEVVLASSPIRPDEPPAPHRRGLAAWSAVALGLLISFSVGFAVAPRGAAEAPTLAGSRNVPRSEATAPRRRDTHEDPSPQGSDAALIASESRPEPKGVPSSGPDVVNVVYRPSGGAEESSAPLPVYKSDEEWARALDLVVRQSEADLSERRAQLLTQGADLQRQIVLHPVATEQGELLLPVETFQIVPVSLKSFH
ncbi:MAG TPA: hypothetical protein VGN57_22780 [Pirellulaceae bacterium]|jgi:hypothetical protein|nr:hypothetical protein [Pirellulaceae bacterium]